MTASRLALVAPLVAGTWAAFNGLLYAADASRRYRAESAWFIFGAVLIAVALGAISRTREGRSMETGSGVLKGSLIVLMVAAFLLYYPMLSIGLLSDDFTLLARSRTGALADPTWEFLRPFPLAIWRAIGKLSYYIDVPSMLHGINIGVHGVNAWLVATLTLRLGLPKRLALVTGVVFLVNPASIEAVAWASGVFDVLLTALLLMACLVVTTIDRLVAASVIAMLTALALMTKETAIVTPALLAIAALSSPHTTLRRTAWPLAAAVIVIGLYIPIRIVSGYSASPPASSLSGYVLKEMVSRPFATLGFPFHVGFLQAHPWLPFVFALLWPALLTWSALRWSRQPEDAHRALACGAWILVSVLPLATMLFIADDLQGARYVYLGSVASAILLAVMLNALRPSAQLMIVVPVIALFIVATRAHQSPWRDASHERDRVLAAYRNSDITCAPEGARGLPDHIRGAYVFRNGFAEAARMLIPGLNDTSCIAVWDGTRFRRD